MGVHSGKFGVVNGYSTVRNWAVVDTMTFQEIVASNTRGGKARRKAIHDWNGSFGGWGACPAVMPGVEFTFQGYTAPDDDTEGSAGVCYEGPAIVESVQIVWNWEAGEVINWTVTMAGNGRLTTSSDVYEDVTDLDAPPVCGTKIEYLDGDNGDGSDAHTEWDNAAQATLNITAANLTYVNSSTIESGECWTKRKPGIIDWSLAVVEQDNIRTKFDKGDDLFIKLYANAVDYWHLAFAKVREFTGLTVDRETGAILAQTVNMDANMRRDSDDVFGFIRDCEGLEFWPDLQPTTTTAAA